MIKTILIEYTVDPLQGLNTHGTSVQLDFERVWLWGLFTTTFSKKVIIPMREPIGKWFKHWDGLIDGRAAVESVKDMRGAL